MEELVMIKDGSAVVSSKKIADVFEKVHRNILVDIKKLDCSDDFRQHNFLLSSYTSSQNKELPCYEITRDGFAFLCMSFTGKKAAAWKEKYINAFNSMESSLHKSIPMMKTLNKLTKIQLDNKDEASEAGRILNNYKKVKPSNQNAIDKAYKDVQLALGFEV